MDQPDIYYQRVYLYTSRVHHLVHQGHSPSSGYPALCGRSPDLFCYWWGTGTQSEYERAEELPLCKPCGAARGARMC